MSTTASTPIQQMPPKLPRNELENLSPQELDNYLDQIDSAAIEQVRTNKEQFLKDYPNLDVRNPPK